MVKIRLTIVIVFTFISVPVLSLSEGEELLEACKATYVHLSGGEEASEEKYSLCVVLLDVVFDKLKSEPMVAGDTKVCVPKEKIDLVQSIQMLISFLERKRDKLHLPRVALIIFAYAEKYPCKEKTGVD